MGNLFSKKQETAQERQERLQQTHGILVPPSFVVVGYNNNVNNNKNKFETIPLSTQARLKGYHSHNILEYLWNSNPGRRLLIEYMIPGIHISVPTTITAVSASTTSTNNSNNNNNISKGQILISLDANTMGDSTTTTTSQQQQQFNPDQLQQIWAGHSRGNFQMEGLVTSSGHPSLRVSYRPNSKFSIAAKMTSASLSGSTTTTTTTATNDKNDNWIDAKYKTQTSSGLGCMCSAWMTGNSILETITRIQNPSQKSRQRPVINIQAAAEYQETIVAVHSKVPLYGDHHNHFLPIMPQIVSTLVSINLNHQTTQQQQQQQPEQSQQNSQVVIPQPPLWLTLRNDNHYYYDSSGGTGGSSSLSSSSGWKLNLSQYFTFDRQVLNVLEERAPMVRQTVGWVVQVEQPNHNNNNNNNNNTNQWSLGATWQWNRSFALKGILGENGRIFKYGIILKRWEQPRVTLSILNQLDFSTTTSNATNNNNSKKSHSFLGFGIELETSTPILLGGTAATTTTTNNNLTNLDDDDDDDQNIYHTAGQAVPPTKIKIANKQQLRQRQ